MEKFFDFFEKIDFTFGDKDSDIKPSSITISENDELTKELYGNVFAFKSPDYTNSSFYVITIPLSEEDLFEVRKHIWNEDKYDLYFLAEKSDSKFLTTLYYAKSNLRKPEIKIKSFKGDKKDAEELESIKKWKFDSGAFWMSYTKVLKNRERVDKKLIEQLKILKGRLQKELTKQVQNPDEIVQALIDRTLFIKFLEDNHIINSFFYNHYFPNRFKGNDVDFGYKSFLKEHDIDNINKLFGIINKIFNNTLFKNPPIKKEYLTDNVLKNICDTIRRKNWKKGGQLSLFDFRFDVIPIEFIGHIYEVFLQDKQKDEGIYYTPKKLADLIIDDTIKERGALLDPACGSGMFLILAFRKFLEKNPPKSDDIYEKIKHKNKLIKDYIYGIEKETNAWRLAIFSLYLEILKDLPPEEIKEFIKQKLESGSELEIFDDFSCNIINGNALDIAEDNIPHKEKKFDYIVGNPPYFEIKSNDEEVGFINDYSVKIDNETIKASEIIGYNQISQCFMLRIKDWAKPDARCGFVINGSNFYNEKSAEFRRFFLGYYKIEEFYELSRVKEILFPKSKESVVVAIFSNKKMENNLINYYPVDMGIFSKTFDLLIIQEDKKIEIFQKDILNEKIILRDYLIGNKFDLSLIYKIKNSGSNLLDYTIKNKETNKGYIHEGLKIVGKKAVSKYYNISERQWEKLNTEKQLKLFSDFKDVFISRVKTDYFNTKYIEPKNIFAFNISGESGFMGDISKFERHRNKDIYIGDKILWNRTGNQIRACYIKDKIYFNFDIHVIKIKDRRLNYLFTEIFNSFLINYYLNIAARKRLNNSFPKISNNDFQNIPIPKELDEDLVAEISEMSRKLTEGELKYEGKTKEKLNDLVFDLYELDILEIIRIKEFFSDKKEADKEDLEKYEEALFETIEMYFEDKPVIRYYRNDSFKMTAAAIYINKSYKKMPSAKEEFKHAIYKIVTEHNEKFLAMREKVYGCDCIYIIKNNRFQNWTTTKAFEDGQEILKRILR